jgi:glycosyltransferase involved in cell wall biosynthesis
VAEINRDRDGSTDMAGRMPSEASMILSTVVGPEPVAPPVAVVGECDVAEGIHPIAAQGCDTQALVLVRVFTEPLGVLTESLTADGIRTGDLTRAIVREFEPELRKRFADCGLPWDGQLPVDGLKPPRTPSFLASRERVMQEGPLITAAVCTRDRPEGLPGLLETLVTQEYQRMRILVVDNAPSDDQVRQIVRATASAHQAEIDYVIEPRPGLSWARNRAIDASDGEVIAWVDDDERCDRWWAAEIARGYVEVPEAGGVAGVLCPLELATESQAIFENFNGLQRNRGFTRWVFSPATADQQSPLYPLPPFGTGGNMSFRRDALKEIGGFDCALGAGTVAQAGEDTAALSGLLLAGGTVVYQPTAVVYHRHRRDYAALRRQLQGYGRGLTAFYASVLLRRPSYMADLLRHSPQAVKDQFSSRGQRLSAFGDDFPRDLLRANRIGLLQGPFAYAISRLHARRLRNEGVGQ